MPHLALPALPRRVVPCPALPSLSPPHLALPAVPCLSGAEAPCLLQVEETQGIGSDEGEQAVTETR